MRSRLVLRRPILALLPRALTALGLLAVAWYGLMVVLLAVKVSPQTVNGLSAYRTIDNAAAGLTGRDFTTPVRLAAGAGGVIVFALFAYLALQELPRPGVVRGGDVGLEASPQGETVVRPRAVERVAEIVAGEHPNVDAVTGRLHQDSLQLTLGVLRAGDAAATLQTVRDEVIASLSRHGLPSLPVDVVLTGFSPDDRALA
jgi:hypothetical protein